MVRGQFPSFSTWLKFSNETVTSSVKYSANVPQLHCPSLVHICSSHMLYLHRSALPGQYPYKTTDLITYLQVKEWRRDYPLSLLDNIKTLSSSESLHNNTRYFWPQIVYLNEMIILRLRLPSICGILMPSGFAMRQAVWQVPKWVESCVSMARIRPMQRFRSSFFNTEWREGTEDWRTD